jgi:hypothetical protein
MEVNRADSAVSRSWGHLTAEAFASSTDHPSIPSCRRVATPPELPTAGRVRPFSLRCRRYRTVNGTSFLDRPCCDGARLVLLFLFGAHSRQTDGRTRDGDRSSIFGNCRSGDDPRDGGGGSTQLFVDRSALRCPSKSASNSPINGPDVTLAGPARLATAAKSRYYLSIRPSIRRSVRVESDYLFL